MPSTPTSGPADRQSPSGISRRQWLHGVVAAAVGTAAGTAAHGFLYERHRVEVTRAVLAVSGWPDGLSGLRVGFITDLHRSALVPHGLVDAAVRLLMNEQPDLIVLGGDYVTWGERRFVQPAADALAPLSAPHGVFGVLGNHDDDRDMPGALEQNGVEMLRDERTRIVVRNEPIDLVGIRYWTRRVADIGRLVRGGVAATILIAHTPSRLVEASALGVPLMLSGHTHGGQVVLPGVGAVAARNFPIVSGAGQRDHTTAFVSRGVGTVYVPIRVACPPEVAILTLKAPELA
jgi:uncharacterized protein